MHRSIIAQYISNNLPDNLTLQLAVLTRSSTNTSTNYEKKKYNLNSCEVAPSLALFTNFMMTISEEVGIRHLNIVST